MALLARDWERFLAGDLFTFFCGHGGKAFSVHAGLVAQVSRPLERLMNNGMVESIQRSANLPEVEPRTFALFSQWLYCGTYSTSEIEPSKAIRYCIRCGDPAGDRFVPFCSNQCRKVHAGRKFSFWRHCVQCRRLEFVNRENMWLTCEACEEMEIAEEPLSKVDLLENVKLYSFADMFMIERLKQQCQQALRELDVDPCEMEDLIALSEEDLA